MTKRKTIDETIKGNNTLKISGTNTVTVTGASVETFKNNKQLLRRLHVKDGDKIIQGAEAFLVLWKKIPKYRFLYKILKLPIIFTLFSIIYEIVAFFLFLKNKKQLRN